MRVLQARLLHGGVLRARLLRSGVNLFKLCPLKPLRTKGVQHERKRVECIFTYARTCAVRARPHTQAHAHAPLHAPTHIIKEHYELLRYQMRHQKQTIYLHKRRYSCYGSLVLFYVFNYDGHAAHQRLCPKSWHNCAFCGCYYGLHEHYLPFFAPCSR